MARPNAATANAALTERPRYNRRQYFKSWVNSRTDSKGAVVIRSQPACSNKWSRPARPSASRYSSRNWRFIAAWYSSRNPAGYSLSSQLKSFGKSNMVRRGQADGTGSIMSPCPTATPNRTSRAMMWACCRLGRRRSWTCRSPTPCGSGSRPW